MRTLLSQISHLVADRLIPDGMIAEVTASVRGVTVKWYLSDDNGRPYWDDAYHGAAYGYATFLVR